MAGLAELPRDLVTLEEWDALELDEARRWELVEGGKLIRRKYKFKDFVSAMGFLQKVGDVAEAEGHHPDLHLTGYRFAAIELTTHAIGGLSENDFVLAAKIDAIQ